MSITTATVLNLFKDLAQLDGLDGQKGKRFAVKCPKRQDLEFPDQDVLAYTEATATALALMYSFDLSRDERVRKGADAVDATRQALFVALLGMVSSAGAVVVDAIRMAVKADMAVFDEVEGASSKGLVKIVFAALNLKLQQLSLSPMRAQVFGDAQYGFVWSDWARMAKMWLDLLPDAVATAGHKELTRLAAVTAPVPHRPDITKDFLAAGDLNAVHVLAMNVAPGLLQPLRALNTRSAPLVVASISSASISSASATASAAVPASSKVKEPPAEKKKLTSDRPAPLCTYACAVRHMASACPTLQAHRVRVKLPPLGGGGKRGGCFSCDETGHGARECKKYALLTVINGTSCYVAGTPSLSFLC